MNLLGTLPSVRRHLRWWIFLTLVTGLLQQLVLRVPLKLVEDRLLAWLNDNIDKEIDPTRRSGPTASAVQWLTDNWPWLSWTVTIVAVLLFAWAIYNLAGKRRRSLQVRESLNPVDETPSRGPSLRVTKDDIRIEANSTIAGGYGWGLDVWNDDSAEVKEVRAHLDQVVPAYRDEVIQPPPTRPLHWPGAGPLGRIPGKSFTRVDLLRYAPSGSDRETPVAEWAYASMDQAARQRTGQLFMASPVIAKISFSSGDTDPYFVVLRIEPGSLSNEAIDMKDFSRSDEKPIELLYAGTIDQELEQWRKGTKWVVPRDFSEGPATEDQPTTSPHLRGGSWLASICTAPDWTPDNATWSSEIVIERPMERIALQIRLPEETEIRAIDAWPEILDEEGIFARLRSGFGGKNIEFPTVHSVGWGVLYPGSHWAFEKLHQGTDGLRGTKVRLGPGKSVNAGGTLILGIWISRDKLAISIQHARLRLNIEADKLVESASILLTMVNESSVAHPEIEPPRTRAPLTTEDVRHQTALRAALEQATDFQPLTRDAFEIMPWFISGGEDEWPLPCGKVFRDAQGEMVVESRLSQRTEWPALRQHFKGQELLRAHDLWETYMARDIELRWKLLKFLRDKLLETVDLPLSTDINSAPNTPHLHPHLLALSFNQVFPTKAPATISLERLSRSISFQEVSYGGNHVYTVGKLEDGDTIFRWLQTARNTFSETSSVTEARAAYADAVDQSENLRRARELALLIPRFPQDTCDLCDPEGSDNFPQDGAQGLTVAESRLDQELEDILRDVFYVVEKLTGFDLPDEVRAEVIVRRGRIDSLDHPVLFSQSADGRSNHANQLKRNIVNRSGILLSFENQFGSPESEEKIKRELSEFSREFEQELRRWASRQ